MDAFSNSTFTRARPGPDAPAASFCDELLDAFPGKVKQVLQKMNVTLQPEHVDVLDNAAATWSNVGTQFTKKGLRDGDNSGWGFGGLFPPVPPPPTVRDIPFFGSTLSRCVRLLCLSSADPF
jgi:hypothetical protein